MMRITAARLIDSALFCSLLSLIVLVAIPYGTAEAWWKGLFQCLVFVLVVFAVIEKFLRGKKVSDDSRVADSAARLRRDLALFLPLLALIAFALVQTIPWSNSSVAGTVIPRTLSADAFQTRLFIIHLCALVLAGWLLMQCTSSQRRLHQLVGVIMAIGVVSAMFGLWRQASQHAATGFVLPNLRMGFGYGQFINSNHFAFLMEMALGLTLGIVVCRGVKGWRLALYLVAAVPMFVALVLANSRGGILSILCQIVFLAAWLVSGVGQAQTGAKTGASRLKQGVVRVVLIATLLIGGVVTVVFVGGDPLAGRIDSMSIELDRKTADTFTLRQNIWRATWELIKDHPFTGVGFGGYWIAISKYHRASGERTPQQAHSDYLELLASGGVIALSIVIWLAVMLARTTRQQLRAADPFGRAVTMGALAGIVTVAVHSLVDFGLHITINALVFTALVALVSMNHGSTKPIPEHE